MPQRIEDYALIGNCETTALVGKNGSIDWLGFPRYDSAACCAALLGSEENGRWLISPASNKYNVTRRYRPGTLVLETEFSTRSGSVVVIDCMDRRPGEGDVLRLLQGVRGKVSMQMELALRFDYGSVVPYISLRSDGCWRLTAGSNQTVLSTPVELSSKDGKLTAKFTISEGEQIPFALTWASSIAAPPKPPSVETAIANITDAWKKWARRFDTTMPWSEAILRSLITVKALTHCEWGGIVAAATTSLPERIGGPCNWDYRFCWLRDATFTLFAYSDFGFQEEAKAWHCWLMRVLAQSPDKMEILYEISGDRRLDGYKIPWLNGYEKSKPVHVGNAAATQLQVGVFGEVVDMLYHSYKNGIAKVEDVWGVEKKLLDHLATIWNKPGEGIWEMRSKPRHFTHSKVMAWVAYDRAIKTVEEFGVDGPVEKWRKLRTKIHNKVLRSGFSRWSNAFVQSFGSHRLDASVLLIPTVGFLPADDRRMLGTVKAVEKHLMHDGLVYRYKPTGELNLCGGAEGAFLACNFWLVDNYVLQNRLPEARALFEKILALRNDVGLLSEEYDPKSKRLVGNFPQVFSHVSLINTAHRLSGRMRSSGRARV